jgi:hypothetical protein
MHLAVPNAASFEKVLRDPPPRGRVAEHIVAALYCPEKPNGGKAPSSGYRHLTTEWAEIVVENNDGFAMADDNPRKSPVLYLPVPQQPLFRIPELKFPFRGVDWAAISMKVIDDGISDPSNRLLAVAAHQGMVVQGYEDRIRAGMLELAASDRLLAYVVANRLPNPPVHGKNIEDFAQKARKIDQEPAVYLKSPHFWWAFRHIQESGWNYLPYNTPINTPATTWGEYAVVDTHGSIDKQCLAFTPETQALNHLEMAARADMGEAPRPLGPNPTSERLARWGLVAYRLIDDGALPRRAGYGTFSTPRGWRTLWAHGRMLKWRSAMETLTPTT